MHQQVSFYDTHTTKKENNTCMLQHDRPNTPCLRYLASKYLWHRWCL